MWVSKPVYESIPYVYLVAGVSLMLMSVYLNYWYWPTICLVLGVACLVAGLVIWLRRRDYRRRQESLDDPLQ